MIVLILFRLTCGQSSKSHLGVIWETYRGLILNGWFNFHLPRDVKCEGARPRHIVWNDRVSSVVSDNLCHLCELFDCVATYGDGACAPSCCCRPVNVRIDGLYDTSDRLVCRQYRRGSGLLLASRLRTNGFSAHLAHFKISELRHALAHLFCKSCRKVHVGCVARLVAQVLPLTRFNLASSCRHK